MRASVVFDTSNAFVLTGIKGFAQLLAWLHGPTMITALEKEIDALPEAKLALSAKEKEKRLRELKASLDTIKRNPTVTAAVMQL